MNYRTWILYIYIYISSNYNSVMQFSTFIGPTHQDSLAIILWKSAFIASCTKPDFKAFLTSPVERPWYNGCTIAPQWPRINCVARMWKSIPKRGKKQHNQLGHGSRRVECLFKLEVWCPASWKDIARIFWNKPCIAKECSALLPQHVLRGKKKVW